MRYYLYIKLTLLTLRSLKTTGIFVIGWAKIAGVFVAGESNQLFINKITIILAKTITC